MPCVIVLLLLGMPRLALFLVFFFSDYLGRAYDTNFWPILGFCFMPLTTLAYAWAINSQGRVEGFALAACVLAALLDLGMLGASRRRAPAEN
jgi:hypothetical protein